VEESFILKKYLQAGMETRAKKLPGGGYRLNGSKMWITNSPIADVAVVWAKDDKDVIRGYLVERGTKVSRLLCVFFSNLFC
jgi:alkylation response protein AidB-like acyl-CoA dehydrogenase